MYIKVAVSVETRGRSSTDMFTKIILALSALAWASAQIPNLGFCPEYIPMANFNMEKFAGVWYEAERYFQLSEVVSRCVMTNYTKGIDGKYRVSNQVTNRFTGIKRILEGEIKPPASKAEEGKLHVRYTTIPLTPETKYSVLETDYDSYAVLWSCQGIGPVHAQSAWVMTRDRIAPGEVLQKAYGVLDKYKISKTFFVRTDQADCAYLEVPTTLAAPAAPEAPAKQTTATEQKSKPKTKPKPQATKPDDSFKSAINLETEAELTEKAEAEVEDQKASSDIPKIIAEESAKPEKIETIPERILKIAEIMKEESGDADKTIIAEISEENVAESVKEGKSENLKEIVLEKTV